MGNAPSTPASDSHAADGPSYGRPPADRAPSAARAKHGSTGHPDPDPLPAFGDPADPDSWRRKGDAHLHERAAAAAASQAAYLRHDYKAAGTQSKLAKRHGTAADAAHARAVALLLRRNNDGKPRNQLDLHGLRVAEALAEVERALAAARGAGQARLVLIVGRGLHSKDGVARLRPAMEGLVRKHDVRYALGVPNEGCITVEFVRPVPGAVKAGRRPVQAVSQHGPPVRGRPEGKGPERGGRVWRVAGICVVCVCVVDALVRRLRAR
ncbi:Smr domain-containing protein [Tetrabaena socialis]|uniref:Smr domain-containing protein n=1 Tax=Tetrabaena socialis TaxID=47790 RepID=A0A2J8AKF0_9CHLO|nr:Smr domain-containing protein [Tetrabaena socialis]|eukprot:PNH12989.1 Smr domain-containing protein [Tetrabaena socialis]